MTSHLYSYFAHKLFITNHNIPTARIRYGKNTSSCCLMNQACSQGLLLMPASRPRSLTRALSSVVNHHHHHHQSLKREGRWGTIDDFATSFLHFSLFSTALWDLPNIACSYPDVVFTLFLCLPCHLPPFTVPCKMVLARPNERETWPYHRSLRLFTIVRWSSCGPVACRILARTYSLVTWSLYEMCSILR